MANLLYVASLALVLSIQVCDADPFKGGCHRVEQNWVDSKVDRALSHSTKCNFTPHRMHKFLVNLRPEFEQATYRGIPVTELLAMENVSEAKCNWDEFARREYCLAIHELEPASCAAEFIAYHRDELKIVCYLYDGEFYQKAEAATEADREMIRELISIGELKKKTDLTWSDVRRASETYVKSKPGKEDFVFRARKIRIMEACKHVIYIDKFVLSDNLHPDTDENLPNVMEVCRVYLKGVDEGEEKEIREIIATTSEVDKIGKRLEKIRKSVNELTLRPLLAFDYLGKFLGKTFTNKIWLADTIYAITSTIPYWFPALFILPILNILTRVVFIVARFLVGRIIGAVKRIFGQRNKRDIDNLKYKVYPINGHE